MDFQKIKVLLHEKGMTVNALCISAGITSPGFHKMIKRNNTSVVNLERISEFLNVSPSYWFENQETNGSLSKMPDRRPGYFISVEIYDKLLQEFQNERTDWREQRKFYQDQIILLNNLLKEKL